MTDAPGSTSGPTPNRSANAAAHPGPWGPRFERWRAGLARAFHAYGSWLVSISWKRFIGLSLLFLIAMGILHDKPPFTWTFEEVVRGGSPRILVLPPGWKPQGQEGAGAGAPADARAASQAAKAAEAAAAADAAAKAASAAQAAAAAAANAVPPLDAASASGTDPVTIVVGGVKIQVPASILKKEGVREAISQAQREVQDAVREAQEDARQAKEDIRQAKGEVTREVREAVREMLGDESQESTRRRTVGIGDALIQFTFLWIMASAMLKATYKGRVQAEHKAAVATQTASAESLKRQVLEARMAAMQAQVEPHFLFNTLASIDHLIETNPARASQMQKNLIALLRAAMPTLREAGEGGLRELDREMAVIRPYLDILKMRMDERLTVQLDVPEGLYSALFPPMMIQTLVENAIKHGLEPKAEGGSLSVQVQVLHGKLQVRVADTGVGFGAAATAGTGVGLANIRERLQLLYEGRAALTVGPNLPSGTVVSITVPYKTSAAAQEARA